MDVEFRRMMRDAETGALHLVAHFAKEANRCRREGNLVAAEVYSRFCKESELRAEHYARLIEASQSKVTS